MKKVKAFLCAMREVQKTDFLACPMTWEPMVQEMIDEIEAAEAEIGLLGKAADDSIGRVIEMNHRLVELERYNARLVKDCDDVVTGFDVLDAQSNATIREMGELIDDYAALVVSFREMPFMCFANDPIAALAAIVKADIDKAPIDWKQWPGVI